MGIKRILAELVSYNIEKKEVTIVDLEEIKHIPCSARTHTYKFSDPSLRIRFQQARNRNAIFIVEDGIVKEVKLS